MKKFSTVFRFLALLMVAQIQSRQRMSSATEQRNVLGQRFRFRNIAGDFMGELPGST